MRMNIQGFDSLAFDEREVDPALKHKATLILHKRLGAARVSGVKDFNLVLIQSGVKKDGPTRVLNVRFTKAKGEVHARVVVSVTASSPKARNAQYVKAMTKVTLDVLQQIEEKTDVDLAKCRTSLERDLAKLAPK